MSRTRLKSSRDSLAVITEPGHEAIGLSAEDLAKTAEHRANGDSENVAAARCAMPKKACCSCIRSAVRRATNSLPRKRECHCSIIPWTLGRGILLAWRFRFQNRISRSLCSLISKEPLAGDLSSEQDRVRDLGATVRRTAGRRDTHGANCGARCYKAINLCN
jgi:hypothetical protein